jgi:hypothetical protein
MYIYIKKYKIIRGCRVSHQGVLTRILTTNQQQKRAGGNEMVE